MSSGARAIWQFTIIADLSGSRPVSSFMDKAGPCGKAGPSDVTIRLSNISKFYSGVPALRDVLRQLVDGVSALHENGKLHRDIKPGNLMVDNDGRLVLLDFGLVSDLHRRSGVTGHRTIAGTCNYMAPEQAAGSRDVGPAADVYALGAILYELLTGRPPFQGATTLETLAQVRGQEPVSPPWMIP